MRPFHIDAVLPPPSAFRSVRPFRATVLGLAIAAVAASVIAAAEFEWGATGAAERDSRWHFVAGAILDLRGSVDETFRATYAAEGEDWKQSLAESYSLSDFGVGGPYPAFGLQYDKAWRFFGFRWGLSLFGLTTDAVALRNYYLGVGDTISYGGREFDHLMIPEGQPFSMEFVGGITDFLWSFTPVTFWFDDQTAFIPSIDAGLVLVGGQFSVDAGSSTGTKFYQDPPVEFVIGGNSSSAVGIGAPIVGLGGELRVGPDDGVQWITKAHVGAFVYDGRTDLFTSAEHRRKNADITFISLVLESSVAFPLAGGRAFSIGGRAQFTSLDGTITSEAKDAETILALRERFDKDFDFQMASMALLVGLSF